MRDAPVILITGATSGLGLAAAAELARRGYRVFGTSRSPGAPPAPSVELLPLDITSDESAHACVADVLARTGRIDALVNNAGAMLFGAAEEVSDAELAAHLDLNLIGAARMVRAALPAMRAQGGGRIINMSSLGGMAGLPYLSAYSASKFALEGYSESLRLELLPMGIFVSLVAPGGARTSSLDRSQLRSTTAHPDYDDGAGRMMAQLRADQQRAGLAPEAVARVVADLLAERRPPLRAIVGSQAMLIAALKRLLPQRWYEALVLRQLSSGPHTRIVEPHHTPER